MCKCTSSVQGLDPAPPSNLPFREGLEAPPDRPLHPPLVPHKKKVEMVVRWSSLVDDSFGSVGRPEFLEKLQDSKFASAAPVLLVPPYIELYP